MMINFYVFYSDQDVCYDYGNFVVTIDFHATMWRQLLPNYFINLLIDVGTDFDGWSKGFGQDLLVLLIIFLLGFDSLKWCETDHDGWSKEFRQDEMFGFEVF